MSTTKDISTKDSTTTLPKVTITYCTQCRWMLRAAYFAQELLSTFGTSLGEVSLKPATGGTFVVNLEYVAVDTAFAVAREGDGKDDSGRMGGKGVEQEIKRLVIWDRKSGGGFPETKVLKQRVRDHIQPEKDLGHSDVGGKNKNVVKDSDVREKPTQKEAAKTLKGETAGEGAGGGKRECEDCA